MTMSRGMLKTQGTMPAYHQQQQQQQQQEEQQQQQAKSSTNTGRGQPPLPTSAGHLRMMLMLSSLMTMLMLQQAAKVCQGPQLQKVNLELLLRKRLQNTLQQHQQPRSSVRLHRPAQMSVQAGQTLAAATQTHKQQQAV